MTTEELLQLHDTLTSRARALMARKNHDYAGSDGSTPFKNFELSEALGICSTELGMALRLSDKLQRITNFLKEGEFKVEDEKLEDTILDGINYLVLIAAKRQERNEKWPEAWTKRSGV